jgi:hypothetical protein
MAENLPKLFERVGLSEKKAAETVANKKLSSVFESVIKEVGIVFIPYMKIQG